MRIITIAAIIMALFLTTAMSSAETITMSQWNKMDSTQQKEALKKMVKSDFEQNYANEITKPPDLDKLVDEFYALNAPVEKEEGTTHTYGLIPKKWHVNWCCARCVSVNLALAAAVTAGLAASGLPPTPETIAWIMAKFGVGEGVATAALSGISGAALAKKMCGCC
jgi:hypothetical protein